MLSYDIALDRPQNKIAPGIFESAFRVSEAVQSVRAVPYMPVVQEIIVQQRTPD